MAKSDVEYNRVIEKIITNGLWDKDQNVRTVWADGTPAYTKSVISERMFFDGTEVPILTTKRVAWKSAIKEILWIWLMKSNSVKELNDMGVHIWDEWEIKEGEWQGTIGPAYGYQLGRRLRKLKKSSFSEDMRKEICDPNYEVKEDSNYIWLDQVEYLIWQLKTNPSSRRHITSLWGVEDLDSMGLNPCVWSTQWLVKEGYLHLVVQVRSNDMSLGNPFNHFQYYVLLQMIAQVTGYKAGTMTFNINDAHIYERHIDDLAKQIDLPQYEAPKLIINPEIKNFYDFTIDDFELVDYKCGDAIKMEVAI